MRASASRKEARRSVGDRLKMRKSTPRPTTKGNGRKRFNASPSPSTKPELKRAFADDDVGEGVRKSGLKKNLIEELDMAAVSADRLRIEGCQDRSKEESPEEASPICKEVVLFSGQPRDGVGGEKGPIEVSEPDSQSMELPERLDNSNPKIALAPVAAQPSSGGDMTVATVADKTVHPRGLAFTAGVEAKQTKGTMVNFPDMAIETRFLGERQLVSFPNHVSRDCCMEESHAQPKQSLLHLAHLDSAETLDRISSQPLRQVDANKLQGSSMPQAAIGAGSHNVEPTVEEVRSQDPNQEYLEHFPPLEKGRTKKLCSSFETGEASS